MAKNLKGKLQVGKRPRLALQGLEIQNFKAIDHLVLEFPSPRFDDEPDIWVLGSKNGQGKTSVLQAISLLFLLAHFPPGVMHLGSASRELDLNLGDLWVRAGHESATVTAVFESEGTANLELHRNGKCSFDSSHDLKELVEPIDGSRSGQEHNLLALAGLTSDPMLLSKLLFFHSYRRVQEGNPELEMLLEEKFYARRGYPRRGILSAFKADLLKMMMGRAELFESVEEVKGGSLIELELLIQTYANARIGKLRPDRGSTLDIRLHSIDSDPNETFSFDGLSSGQKEIISTLYLVARHARTNGGIIGLIDEPELHLNAEWHAQMVEDLHRLAPGSQFILASHSDRVFAAVPPDHRILLENDR